MTECRLSSRDGITFTCEVCGRVHVSHQPMAPESIHLICGAEDEWRPGEESRGLGDTIANLTHAIGIDPCEGCRGRQKWLNWLWPYLSRERRG